MDTIIRKQTQIRKLKYKTVECGFFFKKKKHRNNIKKKNLANHEKALKLNFAFLHRWNTCRGLMSCLRYLCLFAYDGVHYVNLF
jgi:hypothetical protein